MAKAANGQSSIWLAAGQEPPPSTPDTVLLVGPGGAAAMERRRKATAAEQRSEAESDAPAAPNQGEVYATQGDAQAAGDGLSMEADATDSAPADDATAASADDAEQQVAEAPAGNASRDEWARYLAERKGVHPDELASMKREEIKAEVDRLER